MLKNVPISLSELALKLCHFKQHWVATIINQRHGYTTNASIVNYSY